MGRPTQHTFPFSPFVGGRAIRVRYAIPEPHTPRGAGCGSPGPRGGGHSGRDTPGPSFPNPEAKTASADGTAPARVWESRTPPPTPQEKGGARPAAPPSCLPPPFLRRPRHPAPAPADAPDAADNHHTPPDTDTAAGVLSVNPAINTARQTTNTPTTVFPGFVRPVPREAPLATEGVSSRRFGCLVRWRNVCFVAVKLRDKTPPRPCLSKGG